MNNKDKSIYTLTVPCSGEKHRISLTKEGKLKLWEHTDDEIEAELALEKLGGELPECIKIQKAWKNNTWRNDSYWFEQRDNDSVLDDALECFDFAYNYRNSFKKKILGLIGIFIAGFIISVIISLIQQRFDLFLIYMYASINVVFGLYYVYLFLDISSVIGEFFVPFIVVVEFLSYFSSLYDFKIVNAVMLLIFLFLYFVPIIGNKILLGLINEIEKPNFLRR
ncbi:hypothetical protein [Thermoanaerobacterium sp. RBIITD]|uniref:hypothetical protein n=1 Tax=Thermoanaerobacterium sp. RBIITD TaxID=1550240 RepID=UPI000BB9A060|nr:hypothetical protein [Thermoanaerobacterium sp. RBIITD]SNX54065.1 hypothetical protein SAMN05660242_1696 [Thermoanaerobacterium sp. RBIITD]